MLEYSIRSLNQPLGDLSTTRTFSIYSRRADSIMHASPADRGAYVVENPAPEVEPVTDGPLDKRNVPIYLAMRNPVGNQTSRPDTV